MKALTAERSTVEIAEAKPRLAILPLGATEQHSKHLPLQTDTLLCEHIALALAKELDAFCLPALPYSISHMHRGSAGSVWLGNKTLWLVLEDIAASVAESGIENFLILNGHGGNQLLPSVVQDLNLALPQLFSFTHNAYAGIYTSGLFEDHGGLCHGDEFETSLIWHLRPDLIDPALFEDQPEVIPVDALRYASFAQITDLTHTGRPSQASPKKGEKAFAFAVDNCLAAITRTLSVKRRVRGGIRS
ncbi:MAG: creatininase family protein [Terrimicrobiaceae bacterium]